MLSLRVLLIGALTSVGLAFASELTPESVDEKRATELLMAMDLSQDQDCANRRIVEKIFVESYKDPSGERDEIETWTIDRCGKLVKYWVTLTTVPDSTKRLVQVKRQPE